MRSPSPGLAIAIALMLAAFAASAQDGDYSRKGADTCLSCHEDAVTLAVFRTKHAIPSDSEGPFGHDQLQCEACHGPGDAHSGRVRRGQERPDIPYFGSQATPDIAAANDRCLDCHQESVGIGWHNGSHPSDEVACNDCHTSHAARDAVMHTSTQPKVCYDCHQVQRSEARKAFAHPFFEGKMDCTSCHDMHSDTAIAQLARLNVNDTCQQCHAETRGPYLWEHEPVSEDCGLCHTPHGSNHPGMLAKRGPLLCQSCHSQANHPSVAYDTEGLAGNMPSQFLLSQNCMNCHSQVHGSNHPSGSKLMR